MVGKQKLFFVLILALLFTSAKADTFGGQGDPQPNITEIDVYDISSETTQTGRETGGVLVDSGLNTTLKAPQQNETEYRFSFEIVNNGDSNWNIQTDDIMSHEGLNSSWTVDRIWYNVTGDQQYNNVGTFSSGTLNWSLDQNSNLGQTDTMYGKYIVSVKEPNSVNFSEKFYVEDVDKASGSFDYHKFFVEKLGFMDLNLTEPPNDSIVVQNETFLMNGSIECKDGKCGTVTVNPRYNQSSTADTQIPNDASSEPFNTNVSSKQCSLGRGEKCYVNFSVNASGQKETYHLLDYESSSSRDIPNNDSEDNLVQINSAIVIDLNFSEIDFGPLEPGATDKPAENNSDSLYNITVDERGEAVDDLWIRSTDLNSSKLNYNISAENISVARENKISSNTLFNLSNTYQNLKSNLDPGDVLSTFYWIDVPLGIYEGSYDGTIFFKANSTG